jgi:hypothetical protein
MSTWNEWSKHVLYELERLSKEVVGHGKRLDRVLLDSARTDAEKDADVKQIRKDLDESRDKLSVLKDKIELLERTKDGVVTTLATNQARLQGQLTVWHRIWLAILTILVIGIFSWKIKEGIGKTPKSYPSPPSATRKP